ncbi:hypothetical protein ACFX2G_028012 [Malus domestica]
MSATEYHRRFTDLSCYYPETAANPREMLRLFKRETCKKWRTIATFTPCATYQEFFEVLLQIEDSENTHDDEDEDVGKNAQRYGNRGNHHLAREGLKILKGVGTTLDRRAGVLTPVHPREEADPLVVLVFRIKETPAIQVFSFVTGVTPVTMANVRKEVNDVSLADRQGIWPITVLRIRRISLLIYHLQSPYNSFQHLVIVSR